MEVFRRATEDVVCTQMPIEFCWIQYITLNLVRKKNIKVMDVHFSLNEGPNRTHPYTHAISSIQYLNHYGHTPIRDDHK